MVGPNWPAEGEIDIIEGVNLKTNNQLTLHTNNTQCTTNNVSSSSITSSFGRRECTSPPSIGTGCGYLDFDQAAFGSGFNANGGGVFAVLMDLSGIKIWRFQRPNMPPDIPALKPNPDCKLTIDQCSCYCFNFVLKLGAYRKHTGRVHQHVILQSRSANNKSS